MELRRKILMCTYSALLGRISSNVRMITIDWNKNFYHIKAYIDKPTTDEDIEDYKDVSAEVIASFPDIINVKEEVVFSNDPLNKLPALKEMVFLRKGELDS